MTRKEMLKWLKEMVKLDYPYKPMLEALNMAIQALKRSERWEKHICFDCKYFSENKEEYDEKRCLKCTLIGTEWEQKK